MADLDVFRDDTRQGLEENAPTAVFATYEAVQTYGGIGMTDEHEIDCSMKRARVAEHGFGDAIDHGNRWARPSGY